MALNLEQSSGLTAALGVATYANSAGANTNISTTTAITYLISGLVYALAIKAAASAPVTDFRTSATPPAINGAQGAVVVIGADTSGNLQFVQGPVVAYPSSAVAGSVLFPLPTLPAGFCPIAYQVIKNKNTTGTAAWTFGTSLFNASNLSFETAVQVGQLPNAGLTNVSA